MSVEKMTMMNIIGNIRDVDGVLKDILKSEKVDLVSALKQIEDNNFLFDVSDENIDRLIDLNYIATFDKDERYVELLKKGENLKEILGLELDYKPHELDVKLSKEEILSELDEICEEVHEPSIMLHALKKELEFLDSFYSNSFKQISDFSVPIRDLRDMEYFNFKMGILTKDDRLKLKKNYENILAILLHTGSSADGEVYIVLYPKSVEEEMRRILRSLNFREIIIPKEYSGTPQEIQSQIQSMKDRLNMEIEVQERRIAQLGEKYKERVNFLMEQVKLISKLDNVKENIAFSKKYFYLSGWITESDKDEINKIFDKYPGTLLLLKGDKQYNPPTKLRNNWFFKPFQWMVSMYGTPSYNELDPTPFVSLSYMLLFGTMFGDLGQGFVFVLAGMYLAKRKKMELFGGLIIRLGIASMIFGLLYGAVFGIETLIPALWIKPFDNINDMLMIAIFMGVGLLLTAYTYGIINAYKRHDIEEGLFGKEGVAGVVLYITLLALVGGSMLGLNILPMFIGVPIVIVCLLAIVFRLPLTHMIEKKRPLHGDDISGYYVESVFSLLETFLSLLSGTVSFIRVGAFALTHVGLFLAFETIGHMINTTVGNIIVIIIGNIFIIGLEGLIVFIQGMRLQYYELFSRYYKGEGREFNPVSLEK